MRPNHIVQLTRTLAPFTCNQLVAAICHPTAARGNSSITESAGLQIVLQVKGK
jgi:hypothetical protein